MARTLPEVVFPLFVVLHTVYISCAQVAKPELKVVDANVGDFDFDYSGLPGNAHDLQFEVYPGRQECFYQDMKFGADLHIQFEVLKGADRIIDFIIYDPDGRVFWKHLWTTSGKADLKIQLPGVYGLCCDNSHSRFTGKLINLFFSAFIIDEWTQFKQEFEKFDISVNNVAKGFSLINQKIQNMRRYQVTNRQQVARDWFTINANNSYVQNLSIATCVIIILTSAIQVYFVRKLFSSRDVKPQKSSSSLGFQGIKASA